MMTYVIIGIGIIFVGLWLLRTPRYSKIGILLGSMLMYRILGIIYILFGSLAVAGGLGLDSIGPYPITLN